MAGTHPVAVDFAAATIMGFSWEKLPLLRHAFQMKQLNFTSFSAEEIEIVSNRPAWNKPLIAINADDLFQFRPHFGWRGAIERDKALAVSHA